MIIVIFLYLSQGYLLCCCFLRLTEGLLTGAERAEVGPWGGILLLLGLFMGNTIAIFWVPLFYKKPEGGGGSFLEGSSLEGYGGMVGIGSMTSSESSGRYYHYGNNWNNYISGESSYLESGVVVESSFLETGYLETAAGSGRLQESIMASFLETAGAYYSEMAVGYSGIMELLG